MSSRFFGGGTGGGGGGSSSPALTVQTFTSSGTVTDSSDDIIVIWDTNTSGSVTFPSAETPKRITAINNGTGIFGVSPAAGDAFETDTVVSLLGVRATYTYLAKDDTTWVGSALHHGDWTDLSDRVTAVEDRADNLEAPPIFRGLQTTSQTISTATWTDLTNITATTDTHSGWSTVNDEYTIPTGWGGLWRVFMAPRWEADQLVANQRLISSIFDTTNSTYYRRAYVGWDDYTSVGNNFALPTVEDVLDLAAGDTIGFRVWQNSGGNLSFPPTSPADDDPLFLIYRIGDS